jgi:hypothetical protein
MRLVLATYNVHGCVGGDGRFDPERTLGVLRELAPEAVYSCTMAAAAIVVNSAGAYAVSLGTAIGALG